MAQAILYRLCIYTTTKRFYNNINSKTVGSIEEMATAIALTHNLKFWTVGLC